MRERVRESERERGVREIDLIDFFIGRMTVLGRGLVFQPRMRERESEREIERVRERERE